MFLIDMRLMLLIKTQADFIFAFAHHGAQPRAPIVFFHRMGFELRSVLSDFINLRSAECVCSYYGLRVCSQTNKLKIK